MKSERTQTAGIVIAAMLLGSASTWYLLRNQPMPSVPSQVPPAVPSNAPRPEPTSRIKPTGIDPRVAEQAVPLDDDAFEKAIAEAKAARKAGTLKPHASTPEEFARILGKWNYAIHDFVRRFPTAPDEAAPERAAYQRELTALTNDLANLLSDEELMVRLEVETPPQRARYQANLAAGSLGLDSATTSKLEALLAGAYAELAASSSDAAGLDKKVEAMNAKVLAEFDALLSPEQRERLNSMGVDRVLLGNIQGSE